VVGYRSVRRLFVDVDLCTVDRFGPLEQLGRDRPRLLGCEVDPVCVGWQSVEPDEVEFDLQFDAVGFGRLRR